MTEIVKAPWTAEQVDTLNTFQQLGFVHPFTCGNDSTHSSLVATVRGWICPFCDYTQDWCHAIMVSPDVKWLDQKLHEPVSLSILIGELEQAKAEIARLKSALAEIAKHGNGGLMGDDPDRAEFTAKGHLECRIIAKQALLDGGENP